MTIALPRPGEVISYSFLWADEHEAGQEEGVKTRPCVVVMSLATAAGNARLIVLPVTHTPPGNGAHAIEIPRATKLRLGLDDARSWIVLNEANRFIWPGPDIRPFDTPQGRTISYGFLPPGFFRAVRDSFLALDAAAKTRPVTRTE
jgi:hypothetical protein